MEPSDAQLRPLIVKKLSADEIRGVCFDYFPAVYDDLTPGMTKSQMAELLVGHCRRNGRILDLRIALHAINPNTFPIAEKAPIPPQPTTSIKRSSRQINMSNAQHEADLKQVNSFTHEKTDLTMLRIPAGKFLYGIDNHEVNLPEFWISKTPVTNSQFMKFVEETGYITTAENKEGGWIPSPGKFAYGIDWRHPNDPKISIENKMDHPVVQISWHDAAAFANWAGLTLPYEKEWEKAARGIDGREFPWGGWKDGNCNTLESDIDGTTPVAYYSPNGDSFYNCVDMCGNVWEWTTSWYDKTLSQRVLRGGSWSNSRDFGHLAYRERLSQINRNDIVGFRVKICSVTDNM